jgi:hypothetical protein
LLRRTSVLLAAPFVGGAVVGVAILVQQRALDRAWCRACGLLGSFRDDAAFLLQFFTTIYSNVR